VIWQNLHHVKNNKANVPIVAETAIIGTLLTPTPSL